MESHFNWITLFECLSLTHDNNILLAWASKELKLYRGMGKTQAKKISSVQFTHSVMSNTLRLHGLQHARLPCSSPTARACSNSMSIELVMPPSHLILCHPLLLPLSIFPIIRVFSNQSVLCIRWPKYWSFSFNINSFNEYSGLISFRIDCRISLKSEGLSRVFSNTTVQKHQFFSAQLSLWPNSHICTWLLEKP